MYSKLGRTVTFIFGVIILGWLTWTFVVSLIVVGGQIQPMAEFTKNDILFLQHLPRSFAGNSAVLYTHPQTGSVFLGYVLGVPGDALKTEPIEDGTEPIHTTLSKNEYFVITETGPENDSRTFGALHRGYIRGAVFKQILRAD